ncbi:MAG TPA: futalosine hydrolase [Bacteroidales bacterium]|nr:futalosine hydrolase [Bacteroidales bacterium]
MKILIVSATEKEIFPLINKINTVNQEDLTVDTLITGIGPVFTTYLLTRRLSEKDYDLVINAGIAGSFKSEIPIGETVFVQSDQFADLGIEDKNEFHTLFEKGFLNKDQFPFQDAKLENPYDFNLNLRKVSAITVNTTHECNTSIDMLKQKFEADIESMEGAAFFYVCLQEGEKFLQVRTISNFVRERNTANWDIPLAIKNLNQKLFELIDVLSKTKNS